jgi:hypothetical protein
MKRFFIRIRHWLRRLPSRLDGSAIELRGYGCELSPRAFVPLGARRPPDLRIVGGMVSHAGARPFEDQRDTFVRPAEFCEDDLPIG